MLQKTAEVVNSLPKKFSVLTKFLQHNLYFQGSPVRRHALLFTEGLRSPRDRALFGICLFTGCRVSEALALQTTDMKGGTLTNRQVYHEGHPARSSCYSCLVPTKIGGVVPSNEGANTNFHPVHGRQDSPLRLQAGGVGGGHCFSLNLHGNKAGGKATPLFASSNCHRDIFKLACAWDTICPVICFFLLSRATPLLPYHHDLSPTLMTAGLLRLFSTPSVKF